MIQDLTLLAPEIAVLLTAVGALVLEMLGVGRAALPFTVIGLLVATALTLPLLGAGTTVFSGTFRVDLLSEWAKLALLPATALCAVLAHPEIRGTEREGTVHALFSFTALGALVLAGAGDVMFLVLGVLLSSLGSFALAAHPATTEPPRGHKVPRVRLRYQRGHDLRPHILVWRRRLYSDLRAWRALWRSRGRGLSDWWPCSSGLVTRRR